MSRIMKAVAMALLLVTLSSTITTQLISRPSDELVYEGFVDNMMESPDDVVVYVRVYLRHLSGGGVVYIYYYSAYPAGTNCPGAAGCAGLSYWEGVKPSQHEPGPTRNQIEGRTVLDPNGNGNPIWRDPDDRYYPTPEINYH